MQTLTIGRSTYKLSPSRNVGELQAKLSKFTGKTKKTIIAKERRSYPIFKTGQSTSEYVNSFYGLNDLGALHMYGPLNTDPCTLYSGADLHEIMDATQGAEIAPSAAPEPAPDVGVPDPAPEAVAADPALIRSAWNDAPRAPITAADRARIPSIVLGAMARMRAGESLYSACAWLWFRSDHECRTQVDDWLVSSGHSLAELVGTPETRFRCLVDMEFSNADPAPTDPAPTTTTPKVAPADPLEGFTVSFGGSVIHQFTAPAVAAVPAPRPRVLYSEFIRSASKRDAPLMV